ncbi:hypothetical protein [Tessaracoccus sp.]
MTETVTSCPVLIPANVNPDPAVGLHTGTACLAFIDPHFVDEVWEDLLYDGYDHDHGAGGLALNSASVATHLEYDGDFPMIVFRDGAGFVRAVEVALDPYSESWATPTASLPVYGAHQDGEDGHDDPDGHGHGHGHEHSPDGHTHDHGHEGDHEHEDASGHGPSEGWSAVSIVDLMTDRMSAGDPAGLPQADDTGGLVDLVFAAPGGRLSIAVLTQDRVRTLMRMVWSEPAS